MKVIIIYNPVSTGDSKQNAQELEKKLKAKNIDAKTMKTTHAGHGEELAAKYAKANNDVMLISSSGDGGYHEVVNGALSHLPNKLVVGVLPSGNANDHASSVGGDSIYQAIIHKDIFDIDTIKVTATVDGKPWARYAHSYVGVGVTAVAAKKLTEDRPNVVTEKWIVVKSLLSFRYFKVKENGKVRRYSSMLFGNIDRMSKVMKLSENSSVRDGKFEKTSIRFRSKFRLFVYLFTAATVGLKKSKPMKKYQFIALSSLPVQLDGEVYVLDKNCQVTIESVKRNLRCVA